MGKPIWPQIQKLNIPSYVIDRKDDILSSVWMTSGFGSLSPHSGEEAGVNYGPSSPKS